MATLKDWAKKIADYFVPGQPAGPPQGMSNAIGTGSRTDEVIGMKPLKSEKPNPPASGGYKHNSPAKPL